MTKFLSKKSFIAILIVCAIIVIAGIVIVSVVGVNADATVGGGQQLIYEKVFSKEDLDKEAQAVKDFLMDNGAQVSSLQPEIVSSNHQESHLFPPYIHYISHV